MSIVIRCLLLCTLTVISSCGLYGDLSHRYKEFLMPEISLVSVQVLPASGLEQPFELGLRIRNPNNVHIAVIGLSLRAELNDFPVLSGVTNDVPALEPFGETTATVIVGSNLINALRQLVDLLQTGAEPIDYKLEARLAVNMPNRTRLVLKHKGELPAMAR